MIKKIVIAMQAICLLGLSVHAQATDSSTSQTLRLAIGAEPTEGFDPMLGWSHGSYLLLHSPLLKQNADLSWHSYMLDNYQHSEDGKEWILTLKEGLKFSDGSPLRAKDIVFTYNNAAASGGKVDMGNFAKAEVIDPLTVKITLSSPQSTFINVLGSLGIVSADKYDAKKYAHNPIGAGPYRLVAFQPGQQLMVERNPYYAGPKNNFDKMPDGKMTSMDNTRINAARDAGIKVEANVRNFNDPLPKDMIDSGRFGSATTWGEAITGRINNQSGNFSKNTPYGSTDSPRITGKGK